ncbi:MAG TPA: TetR/AcrR family transcriptional regulator [Pyrinomonadaceae bacterium]|nr:TetR/AcrR family transcriptional regulator [Pyrinomonadaceae bacterium]
MSKQITEAPAAALPVGGGRMAGEERRLQILRVAVRLFSQRGFRGTTTKEIAQAAGVSEAMVFRHFATKEELYNAILDHKACAPEIADPCKLVEDAVLGKDDRAVFETLAFTALEHHDQDREFLRLLLHSALEGHELAQMFWDRNVLEIYEFLGAYVAERQRDGAFRPIEPKVVVRAFIGMLIHHSLNNNLWDPSRRLLDITNEDAARAFTEILLRGIRTEAGQQSLTLKAEAVEPAGISGRKKKRTR